MRNAAALLFLFISCAVFSQELYLPLNIRAAVDKGTRTTQGVPGKNYWQNFADYDLNIRFTPKSRLVSGNQIVTYSNNSPDTLKTIVLRLYPNFYLKGFMRDREIDPADESEGVILDQVTVGNTVMDVTGKDRKVRYDGTIVTLRVPPIPPGSMTKLNITWHYTLNEGSHNRMGQVAKGSYFLGFAFPRIAVYDDVEGWDRSQYRGRNEPYFDYGNFQASITVPKDYVVWATGELQNPDEVFRPAIAAKYKSALASDAIVNVIDSSESTAKKVTAPNKWNTFKFKASFVPDFAFATSDHYIWQACGITVDSATGRRVMVNTAFNKNQKDFFEVNDFSRKTVEVMSFDFPGVPFPYPHITIFEGLDQMEYPMMVNDNAIPDRAETIELTDHEIVHTMFPFYVGTNQTRYAWMDEGWATIGEWYISPKIDSTIFDEYGIEPTRLSLGREVDVPLIISSYELDEAYFVNAYAKPAFIFLYLKDMLGDSLFRKALGHYIDTWKGKHPLPWDFFYAINNGSGVNLDWYWKAWFYDYGPADIAITSVKKILDSNEIIITSKGTKPVPVHCEVLYEDGSTEKLKHTAAIWENRKEIILRTEASGNIAKVTVLHPYVPDVDEGDNIWKAE